MVVATKPLLSHVAADLMSPATVTIPQDVSLQCAARMLARANVSGAPVVDSHGRCVGVLTAHDFLCWAEKGQGDNHSHQARLERYCSPWQITAVEELPEDAVCNHMTADPVSVPPGETIGVMARMMVDAHIHRLIVLDRADRPVGIVSSTDVLAAVARAAQGDGDHS
jgi:CBS domain-containing protein